MQSDTVSILIYAAGLMLMLFCLRILKKPLLLLLRLFINTLLGGIFLIFINTYGAGIGLFVAVNPISALICGILGLPGAVMLLLVSQMIPI